MKRLLARVLAIAGSLALAGGLLVAAAAPAGATPPVSFAYGSFALPGAPSGDHGLASAVPAQTTVAYNVNVNGLLSTGTTTDTAGLVSAYAKVTHPSASTSWAVGPATYTLTLSASQVATYCNDNSGTPTASVNIISGTLTETAVTTLTGVQTSYQVFNLPQLPAIDQTYSYHGASVFLNAQSPSLGGLQTVGIYVNTPAPQLLFLAVTGCGENGTA